MIKWIALVAVVIVAAIALFFVAMSLASGRAPELGVTDGRFVPCPDKPNCVSSQAEDEAHAIDPIQLAGDPQAEFARLRQIIQQMPRVEIVTADERYLHATFTTALMRYVDDVELWLDPKIGVAHIRSASRVGYSDLGANRARVETIRQAYNAGSES